MQQNPSGSSSFPSNQYATFLGQPSMEDGNLVSKRCFPRKKWLGQASRVSCFFYSIDPPTGKRHAVWRRLQNGLQICGFEVISIITTTWKAHWNVYWPWQADIDGRILELIYMQVYAPTTLAPACDFKTLRYTSSLEDGSLLVHYSHARIHSPMFHWSIYRIGVLQIHLYSFLLSQSQILGSLQDKYSHLD